MKKNINAIVLMVPVVDNPSIAPDISVPVTALNTPKKMEMSIILTRLLVSKYAVAAGITKKAITNMAPTE